MAFAIRGLIGFIIWIVAIVLFFVWGFTFGEAKPSTTKTIADILVVIDMVGGVIAFVSMIYYSINAITGHGKNDKKEKKSGKFSLKFQYIIASFAIAVGLSAIFILCAIPFLESGGGTMSFFEKAAMGQRNFWRFTYTHGILTILFTIVAIIRRRLRMVSIWLICFWLVLAGVTYAAEKKGNTGIYTDQSVSIIKDRRICNEQESLKTAKLCTFGILRDDGGHGSAMAFQKNYLVTNKHVIEGAKTLKTSVNGKLEELTVWNYSPTLDVAILKLPQLAGESLSCKWFDSSQLQTAEVLYAIGWPGELTGESTITRGIFSRLNKFESGVEFVQTDAAINPGNSGGPLINQCGVVGINTLKEYWTNEQLPRPLEGLGNALSSNILIPLVENLIKEGKNNTAIPQTAIYTKSSTPNVPSSSPILDLTEINRYVANLREVKKSWEPKPPRAPQDLWNQLMDSLTRQILFSETLIKRLEGGKRPTQDDLFMWDAIVKMSYESSAIANRLIN